MKNKLAAYTAALNAYDLDAVEAMFAEDAVYISPGLNGKLEGRAAIMAAFKAYFDLHSDQVNVDFDVLQVNEFTMQAGWQLRSSLSSRIGLQSITFNENGCIAQIIVWHDE